VGSLSGGNVQKVLLARVLMREPKVIVVAQPTRGLDVGAAEYIHRQLLERRAVGAGVLLVSEDLEELLALCDRILVLFEGRVTGALAAAEATPERLGLLMTGAAA
jgi:simple sugar transport system ATP-binding protein